MDLEISGCNGKVDNGCNIGKAEVTSLKLHLRLGGMLLAILGATLLGTPTDTEWDIRASLGEQLLENTTWGQESGVNIMILLVNKTRYTKQLSHQFALVNRLHCGPPVLTII